ncbi:hypothetical protein ACO0LM_26090 [Undibacterium sp. Di26W]|uniref:hypothetical protein n=1 Tax=Undibacterium sp. Di26W TaxID=3413035 RepID=UPI003BF1AE24
MVFPDTFFLDLLKALIGSFAGAAAAFYINWHMRQSQREDDQVAAGNLAIMVLGRMINAFLIYKQGVLEDKKHVMEKMPNLPLWMQMRPILHEFDESLAIDMQSLTFLVRPHSVDAMNHILIAQGKYRNLVYLQKQHFKDAQELQRILSELQGDNQNGSINLDIAEKKVPAYLSARIESTTAALHQALIEDEAEMIGALQALEKTLASTLVKNQIVRITLPKHLISAESKDQNRKDS